MRVDGPTPNDEKPTTKDPITVVIADDHRLARAAVRTILVSDPDSNFHIVGEATTADEAVAATRRLRPQLVLMDITMPGGGIEATRRIKSLFPTVHIVIITVADDAQTLFEALRAGAQGYLLKDLEPRQWTAYLRSIVDGETPLSPTFTRRIVRELIRTGPRQPDPIEELTTREWEVLELVAQGLTNNEIATALSISKNTVKNHLKNILGKLQVDNRTQLVRFALERGLIG